VWSLELITAPTGETVTVPQVRAHSRLSALTPDEESDVVVKIAAAVAECENFTGRQLLQATWELKLASWCEEGIYRDGVLRLPKPPLLSVSSVKYLDPNGVEITWSSSEYVVVNSPSPHAQRAHLFPAYGIVWPAVRYQPGAIKVRFVAGYGAAETAIPRALTQGVLLRVAEMYERREEQTIGSIVASNMLTAERLWWPFRTY
jgi:uncharacterized phiE125 gp8 family phage protein